MYESLVFAPLKDRHSVTEVDEALKLATEYVVTPTEVRLGDLQINTDATITNGEPRKVTVYGFEHFCKILGIPNPFARPIQNSIPLFSLSISSCVNMSTP